MKRFRGENEEEKADRDSRNVANWLMLLAHGYSSSRDHDDQMAHPSVGRVFECKTCKRQFPSFQALGGHTTSHKKPKPIHDHHDRSNASQVKPRTHECSICGLEFTMGQALGGHMRRHRNTIDGYPEAVPLMKKSNPTVEPVFRFDLNLTPSENNDLVSGFGRARISREINLVH